MFAKTLSTIVGLCFLLGGINHITAADKPAGGDGDKKPLVVKSIPFHGKLDGLDKSAKTIKVGNRIFQVVDATRIMKGGKSATIEDAALGEEVGGSYHEAEAGKLELLSLRIGAKTGKEKKEKEKTE